MIYLVYVLDEGGNPLWTFKYEKVPKELQERILDKEESAIAGFVAAIRFFGLELTGLEVNVIDFGPLNLFVKTYRVDDRTLVVAAFTDATDNPHLVKRILDKFFSIHGKDIIGLPSLMLQDAVEYGKKLKELEFTFNALLKAHQGPWEIPARRNIESLLLGVFVGFVLFLGTVGVTWYLNRVFDFIGRGDYETLLILIAFLNFFFPSIFVGIASGSRSNAVTSGLIIGFTGALVVAINWWDVISRGAFYLFHIGQAIVLVGVILVGVILGGGFGVLAAFSAYVVSELRWLSPPGETLMKPTFKEAVREVIKVIVSATKRGAKKG